MTADDSSDGISAHDQRINQEPIQESTTDDDTSIAEDMDAIAIDLTENDNLLKSHIIMRFDGNGRKTNVGF